MEGMDPNSFSNEQHTQPQKPLPNAQAILVLGICSIVFSLCYGIPGLACAITALIMSSKAKGLQRLEPYRYTTGSVSNMNAGRICAIIGLIFSILMIIVLIIFAIWMIDNIEKGTWPPR